VRVSLRRDPLLFCAWPAMTHLPSHNRSPPCIIVTCASLAPDRATQLPVLSCAKFHVDPTRGTGKLSSLAGVVAQPEKKLLKPPLRQECSLVVISRSFSPKAPWLYWIPPAIKLLPSCRADLLGALIQVIGGAVTQELTEAPF